MKNSKQQIPQLLRLDIRVPSGDYMREYIDISLYSYIIDNTREIILRSGFEDCLDGIKMGIRDGA